jgi:release factor glutamine methyltransferase
MLHTLQELLRHGQSAIEAALGLPPMEARIEAQSLMQHVLDVPRAFLFAHPEELPEEPEQRRFEALLARRLGGEPMAYILGEREFFGLAFAVTPAVLIPRPETELLVELALQRIAEAAASGASEEYAALDLGVGSGAVALSIAAHYPHINMTACDKSAAALEVARENAGRLNIANAAFLASDWYAALEGERYNLIVSNPPYVAEHDPHLKQGDLRFEPWGALSSGADGLADIRAIVAGAAAHLKSGGWLMFEHGFDQAEQARELLRQAGFVSVFSAKDLAGIERVTGGQFIHSA